MKPCIACGGTKFKTLFSARSPDFSEFFDIEECVTCGLKRSEVVNDVSRFYTSSNYFAKSNSVFNKIKQIFANFLKVRPIEKFKSSGKLLDVGCGDGEFLRYLDNKKWELFGIEPFGYTAKPGQNFKFIQGVFEKTNLPDNVFDVITFWHVLEHVDNPITVLKECKRILKKDGLIFISVPNSGSLGFKLFRSKWFALYPPIHIHHYDIKSINMILTKAGFKIIEIDKFTPDYAPFVIAQSVLNNFGFFEPNYLYKMLRGNTKNRLADFAVLLLLIISTPLILILLAIEALDPNGSSVINIYAKPN